MIWIDRCYRYAIFAVDLDDGSGSRDWKKSSLSATKLCGYLAVLAGIGIVIAKKDVTTPINFLIMMGISALFGRSMWKTWLMRNQFATSIAESHETRISHATAETKQLLEIRAARDVDNGFDPSAPRPDPAHQETT